MITYVLIQWRPKKGGDRSATLLIIPMRKGLLKYCIPQTDIQKRGDVMVRLPFHAHRRTPSPLGPLTNKHTPTPPAKLFSTRRFCAHPPRRLLHPKHGTVPRAGSARRRSVRGTDGNSFCTPTTARKAFLYPGPRRGTVVALERSREDICFTNVSIHFLCDAAARIGMITRLAVWFPLYISLQVNKNTFGTNIKVQV